MEERKAKIYVGLRIKPDILGKLREKAQLEHRTLNNLIDKILDEYFEFDEKW